MSTQFPHLSTTPCQNFMSQASQGHLSWQNGLSEQVKLQFLLIVYALLKENPLGIICIFALGDCSTGFPKAILKPNTEYQFDGI